MTDLEDAIQRCLTSARRQLDTGYGPELFVALIDVDRVIRHGSATKNCDEFLEGVLFCVWDMVREKNLMPPRMPLLKLPTRLRRGQMPNHDVWRSWYPPRTAR